MKSLLRARSLSGYDLFLLIFRSALGIAMIAGHGWGKLMRFFSDEPLKFSDPIGIGSVPSLVLVTGAEFFCSILLILGLFSRFALVPLMFAMAVAMSTKFGSPFQDLEKAYLYFMAFLFLFVSGPGKFSLDDALFTKSR